jgi:hypothetical protein
METAHRGESGAVGNSPFRTNTQIKGVHVQAVTVYARKPTQQISKRYFHDRDNSPTPKQQSR